MKFTYARHGNPIIVSDQSLTPFNSDDPDMDSGSDFDSNDYYSSENSEHENNPVFTKYMDQYDSLPEESRSSEKNDFKTIGQLLMQLPLLRAEVENFPYTQQQITDWKLEAKQYDKLYPKYKELRKKMEENKETDKLQIEIEINRLKNEKK
eukprot:378782_1